MGGVSDLILRPFEGEADTRRLGDIWFEASLIAHPFVGLTTLLEQRPFVETVYLPMATTWVATKGDETVGFISLLQDHVAALFVDPRYQGFGIGRALLDHARRSRGHISLEVYSDNLGAVGFYEAQGFVVESRQDKDFDGNPFPNARMVWSRT